MIFQQNYEYLIVSEDCKEIFIMRKIKTWFLEKRKNFIPFSETARKNSAWLSIRHTLREQELYADHFSELFVFFYNFCTLSENFSDVRWNLFCEFVITLLFVSIGTYWGKIKNELCERRLIFLSFSETARKTSAWWSTLHSPRKWDLYADHFFELFVFFTIFVLWAKIFRTFVETFSASLWSLYCSYL